MTYEVIDLPVAIDKVAADLAAQFTDFNAMVAEDGSRAEVQLPALIVHVTDIEPRPDEDGLTGQFPADVVFVAHVIMGHRTQKVRRQVAAAAANVAAFVYKNRWEIKNWGPANVRAVEPDEFAPEADTYDIWRIEWTQLAHFGDSLIPIEPGVVPKDVCISWAPDIGIPNEPSYVEITDPDT